MSSILERLQGGSAIPWIPDEKKAAEYTGKSGKDCCTLNPLIGVAVDHYRRDNFNGDGQYDVIVLTVDIDGKKTDVAVHCQSTVLADQMRKARPHGGEEVGVVFNGYKPGTRGNDYGDFRVVVEREAAGEFDWSDAGSVSDDPVATRQVYEPDPQRQPIPAATYDDDSIPF